MWDALFKDASAKGSFSNACDTTFDAFPQRYRETLRWTYENFRETVAKGCFPLHPMTTALLCNIQFQQASGQRDPRTVLGFVLDQLELRKCQPLMVNDRINWILPVELVDFFSEQLAGERYRVYDNARRMIGPNTPEEHKFVIKALLLHDVAELRGNFGDQISQLATMAGLDEDTVKSALTSLAERHAIRKDPTNRKVSFLSGGVDIDDYEILLQEKLKKADLDPNDFKRLGTEYLSSISAAVDWGKPDDWAAKSILLPATEFNVENIQKEISSYHVSPTGIVEGRRGLVFWILANTSSELNSLVANANQTLDGAVLKKDGMPILVVFPRDPSPNLFNALIRRKALESLTLDEKEKYKDLLGQDKVLVTANILREMRNLSFTKETVGVQRPRNAYLVSKSCNQALLGAGQISVGTVLTACYQAAYRFSPPEFYTQYGQTTTNLKNAVKMVGKALMGNSVVDLSSILGTTPVAKQIIDKFLIMKWGILNAGTKRIQPPTNARLKSAWVILDEAFTPKDDQIAVQPILVPLFDPPYGYDINTLTLLFCAWFGYNFKDLQVSIGSAKKTPSDIANMVEAGPKDFITKICVTEKLYLARQDLDALEKSAMDAIDRIDKGGLTVQQAEGEKPVLENYYKDDRFDAARRDTARTALEALTTAIALANSHELNASKIKKNIEKTDDFNSLIRLKENIQNLPTCSTVHPTSPKGPELVTLLNSRLKEAIEKTCHSAQNLKVLRDYGLYKTELETLKKQLQKEHLVALVEQVDTAIQALEKCEKVLEHRREEKSVREKIEAMDPRAGLKKLRENRDILEEMEGYSATILTPRDNRLKIIQGKINELEDIARNIISDINTLANREALEQWHNRYLVSRDKIEATEFQKAYEQANSVYELRDKVLEELKTIENSPIQKPTDVAALAQRLDKLKTIYPLEQDAFFNTAFQKSREHFASRYNRMTNEALSILEGLEGDFKAGQSPLMIWQRMVKPPIFLPVDRVGQWEGLKARVKAKMDEDIVSDIVERFKHIEDPEKQEECLKQLESILMTKAV